MRIARFGLAAPFALLAGASPALGHPGDAYPPHAEAALLRPHTFIRLADLDFGTIIVAGIGGTVTIEPATGNRTASPGLVLDTADPGDHGHFTGAGSAGQQVVLALTPPAALIDGNGNSLSVVSMSLDGPASRTIGADQSFYVRVGGVIAVAADQAAGTYSGTYDLKADFQ